MNGVGTPPDIVDQVLDESHITDRDRRMDLTIKVEPLGAQNTKEGIRPRIEVDPSHSTRNVGPFPSIPKAHYHTPVKSHFSGPFTDSLVYVCFVQVEVNHMAFIDYMPV